MPLAVPPVLPVRSRRRRAIVAAFWATFLLGIPFWYSVTSLERLRLPRQAVQSWVDSAVRPSRSVTGTTWLQTDLVDSCQPCHLRSIVEVQLTAGVPSLETRVRELTGRLQDVLDQRSSEACIEFKVNQLGSSREPSLASFELFL